MIAGKKSLHRDRWLLHYDVLNTDNGLPVLRYENKFAMLTLVFSHGCSLCNQRGRSSFSIVSREQTGRGRRSAMSTRQSGAEMSSLLLDKGRRNCCPTFCPGLFCEPLKKRTLQCPPCFVGRTRTADLPATQGEVSPKKAMLRFWLSGFCGRRRRRPFRIPNEHMLVLKAWRGNWPRREGWRLEAENVENFWGPAWRK